LVLVADGVVVVEDGEESVREESGVEESVEVFADGGA
jgi:hypothetical protein